MVARPFSHSLRRPLVHAGWREDRRVEADRCTQENASWAVRASGLRDSRTADQNGLLNSSTEKGGIGQMTDDAACAEGACGGVVETSATRCAGWRDDASPVPRRRASTCSRTGRSASIRVAQSTCYRPDSHASCILRLTGLGAPTESETEIHATHARTRNSRSRLGVAPGARGKK